MHCATCGYALWNLTSGRCPECGSAAPLAPSGRWNSRRSRQIALLIIVAAYFAALSPLVFNPAMLILGGFFWSAPPFVVLTIVLFSMERRLTRIVTMAVAAGAAAAGTAALGTAHVVIAFHELGPLFMVGILLLQVPILGAMGFGAALAGGLAALLERRRTPIP